MSQYRERVSVVFRCLTSPSRWEGGGCASCFVLVEFTTAKQESNNVVFFLLETLFLVNSVPVKRSEERSGLCFSFFKRGSR